MKGLLVNLPQSALLTIYKSFIRPHLEYGDILYDKPDNESFQNKIEKVQDKAGLAITGAIQGTSWEKLKADIRNAKSISIFNKLIVSKKHGHSFFTVYDPLGEKFLTRLRLKFTHLKEHKFRHGFTDTINPMCACGTDVETTEHFLLRCHFYSTQRLELFDNLERANPDFKNLSDKDQVSFMLYGSKTNTSENFNQNIIKIIIKYLKETGRFENFLLWLKPMKLVFLYLTFYFNIFL